MKIRSLLIRSLSFASTSRPLVVTTTSLFLQLVSKSESPDDTLGTLMPLYFDLRERRQHWIEQFISEIAYIKKNFLYMYKLRPACLKIQWIFHAQRTIFYFKFRAVGEIIAELKFQTNFFLMPMVKTKYYYSKLF